MRYFGLLSLDVLKIVFMLKFLYYTSFKYSISVKKCPRWNLKKEPGFHFVSALSTNLSWRNLANTFHWNNILTIISGLLSENIHRNKSQLKTVSKGLLLNYLF